MPIQWLDVILILVMVLSAFLGMRRGFIQEMLLLMSWAFAALVALFVYQLYRERVRALIGSQLLADLLLVGIVFLIMLLVIRVVIDNVFPNLPDNAVNRTLGFIYGLVRGLLLVVIAYEIAAALVPKESLPRWVTEARSLPIIERTGRALLSVLPDNPASIFRSSGLPGGVSPDQRQVALGIRKTHFHVFPAHRPVAGPATAS